MDVFEAIEAIKELYAQTEDGPDQMSAADFLIEVGKILGDLED